MKLHYFMYNFNNIFHIAIYNSFNGVLQMLQRSYSVVKIYLLQFINVYAHWVVVGHLGYFRQKYQLLNYICYCKQNTINSFSVQWNMSNPTHQGTREKCRTVQDVEILWFYFSSQKYFGTIIFYPMSQDVG